MTVVCMCMFYSVKTWTARPLAKAMV